MLVSATFSFSVSRSAEGSAEAFSFPSSAVSGLLLVPAGDFSPFLPPWLLPGGQRGFIVGIGMGRPEGKLVFDKPAGDFSRGRASRNGLTGLVAGSETGAASTPGRDVPLATLLSEEFSILVEESDVH